MMKIQFLLDEIKDQYLIDERPWIIGFSGGKDSSMVLQLVWYALRQIPKEKLTKSIHVICNDTLVENPKIVEWIDKSLENIKNQAKKEDLPFIVAKTTPLLEDTFWVNLIGKGYPSPNSTFRWCTERLKIKPTSRYIMQQIKQSGEVIILLGTRTDESSNRKRSMEKFQIDNQRLKRHVDLHLAYVYTPVKNVTTNEVWQYLMQVPSPWNGTNRDLVTLYKNGSGGDCPLVIDTSTPSCGQSRFGCWVCTVVSKDRSMEAMIDNGEDWMEPMLELRDWLVENRDVDEYRMEKRRNGQVGRGPYTIQARAHILGMLLAAQKTTGQELMNNQELKAIQVIWNMDGFGHSVYDVYNKIYGIKLDLGRGIQKDILKQKQTTLLKKIAEEQGADFDKIQTLLKVVSDKNILSKRVNIQKTIKNLFEPSNSKSLASA
jgi:DNA sulfur modification protein DndC